MERGMIHTRWLRVGLETAVEQQGLGHTQLFSANQPNEALVYTLLKRPIFRTRTERL